MEPRIELCVFRVGATEFAIDIMRVREIVPPLPVTKVPRAPSFVDGVVRLREAVIPLVDLRLRLGAEARTARSTRLVITRLGRRVVALTVDEVIEVLRVARSEIEPSPIRPGRGPRVIVGVTGRAERMRLLLDVKALLVDDRPIELPRPEESTS